MSTAAVLMMIVAMVIVWGGLLASVLFLRSRPQVTDGPHEDPDLVANDDLRAQQPHPRRDT